MPVHKRTYAAFLLIIFSVITFHDLMPHAHHDHDDVDAHAAHHEDHHEEGCSSILGSLGHVLHLHTHSHNNCEIDVCPEVPAIKQNQRDSNDNPNKYYYVSFESSDQSDTGANSLPVEQLPAHNANAFLESISLRGPPTPTDC